MKRSNSDHDLSMNPPKRATSTSLSTPSGTSTSHTDPAPGPSGDKMPTIAQPFEWAKKHRAKVHNLNYLLENKIDIIEGKVQCKICNISYIQCVILTKAVKGVHEFIQKNQASMHDKAPEVWMKPELERCVECRRDGIIEPSIEGKKKNINWLFLFLTQWLGCCDLGQLKYFLKHNNIAISHSEDKQHVLYATYMAL